MKKHTWILVLLFIILGDIGCIIYIKPLFVAIIVAFLWAGFWSIMYGMATAVEVPDDNMDF